MDRRAEGGELQGSGVKPQKTLQGQNAVTAEGNPDHSNRTHAGVKSMHPGCPVDAAAQSSVVPIAARQTLAAAMDSAVGGQLK